MNVMKKISITLSAIIMTSMVCAKSYTVGLSVWSGYDENVQGFKAAMAEKGLVEGENIHYILRNAQADKTKQQDIADEFKVATNAGEMDLVYSLTTPGTVILKETLSNSVPIVFSIVTFPADSGLIESFEYSANNLVGTSNFVAFKYYVELLKNFVPNAQKVAIFRRKGEVNSKLQAVNLKRLFRRAGITVLDQPVNSIDELVLTAKDIKDQVDAFITTTDTLLQNGGEKALIDIELGVPILSSNKQGINDGATFGPVADFYTLGKLSGEMAAQILLNKKKPSSLQSMMQEPPLIIINKYSLEMLELTIPENINDYSFSK